jgi:hypothetical protein
VNLADDLIIKETTLLRGRQKGEIPRLIREGALAAGFAEDRMTMISDECEALTAALRRARLGDLVIAFLRRLLRTAGRPSPGSTGKLPMNLALSFMAARTPIAPEKVEATKPAATAARAGWSVLDAGGSASTPWRPPSARWKTTRPSTPVTARNSTPKAGRRWTPP